MELIDSLALSPLLPPIKIGGQEIVYIEGAATQIDDRLGQRLVIELLLPTGRRLTYRCDLAQAVATFDAAGDLICLQLSGGQGIIGKLAEES